MPSVAVVSFRLGGEDGVSVEAAKWCRTLAELGWSVETVAGSGSADVTIPGLAIGSEEPPPRDRLASAFDHHDLVVVENLCSLPLNPAAGRTVAELRRGRPTVLHHHDLPWQRPHLAALSGPPDDGAWRHVTINELSRRQLRQRGIGSTTIPNTFDPSPRQGHRREVRRLLGLGSSERLFLQPTRALHRKNVAGGLTVSEELGATYWLLGPAEDGYGPHLDRLVSGARTRVIQGTDGGRLGTRVPIEDAYAACDAVLLPSSWEGFGNPAVESALYRRPLVIGPYPVARELASHGFEWFPVSRPRALGEWLAAPDEGLLDRNQAVARLHFSSRRLPGQLRALLGTFATLGSR